MSCKVFMYIFLVLEICAVSHAEARKFPSLEELKRAYPGYWLYGGSYTSSEIKAEIGGNVNAAYIDNTCSVRMSRALNKISGHSITAPQWDPIENRYDSVRGADNKQYIFRVTGLARYLTNTYGSPDVHSFSINSFTGKKGIMRLNLPGSSDYTGHFALWDGSRFYQSKDYSDRATDMWLWETNERDSNNDGNSGHGHGSARGGGGGCFPSHAHVIDINKGTMPISDVVVGDKLLSVTKDGKLQHSDVIGWLHRDADRTSEFYEITTIDGKIITLSGDHIIFKSSPTSSEGMPRLHTFASNIQVGDHILTKGSGSHVAASQVSNVTKSWQDGVYAPLTREGTIIVDHVAASCYAAVDDHNLAHAALFPVRAVDGLVPGAFAEDSAYLQNYIDLLQYTARLLMDKKRFHHSFNQ